MATKKTAAKADTPASTLAILADIEKANIQLNIAKAITKKLAPKPLTLNLASPEPAKVLARKALRKERLEAFKQAGLAVAAARKQASGSLNPDIGG